MKSRTPMGIEVLRGSVVESVHHVMVVTADTRGFVSGYLGNTDYLVYPRSSIKMLQAIPFVESGAMEKYELDDRMLAFACSSHRGEKMHLQLASQWFEKIKGDDSLLACGPAWPAHEPTQFEMIRKGLNPAPMVNNCSGKHLGLISTCLVKGENPTGYHKHESASQARLRKVMTEASKFNHEKALWGIDGCSIPTYALPLQNLAFAMATLLGDGGNATRKRTHAAILEACRRHPQYVSGTDDFVTAIVEKTNGRALVKSGAEGVYTGLVPERGLSFALKVHDGHKRAAEVATAFVLRMLGGLSENEYLALKAFTMPELTNSRGEKVGEIRLAKG